MRRTCSWRLAPEGFGSLDGKASRSPRCRKSFSHEVRWRRVPIGLMRAGDGPSGARWVRTERHDRDCAPSARRAARPQAARRSPKTAPRPRSPLRARARSAEVVTRVSAGHGAPHRRCAAAGAQRRARAPSQLLEPNEAPISSSPPLRPAAARARRATGPPGRSRAARTRGSLAVALNDSTRRCASRPRAAWRRSPPGGFDISSPPRRQRAALRALAALAELKDPRRRPGEAPLRRWLLPIRANQAAGALARSATLPASSTARAAAKKWTEDPPGPRLLGELKLSSGYRCSRRCSQPEILPRPAAAASSLWHRLRRALATARHARRAQLDIAEGCC